MTIHIKKRYRGIHFWRTKREPLERAFAVAWQKLQESSGITTLEYLLASDNNRPLQSGVSERDLLVANTVIQWLGSNVGQCFLDSVDRKAGR